MALIFAHFFVLFLYISHGEDRSATTGYGGMVGSAHHLATEAGLEVLRNGGNAADAAIAVQMTLNLVQPMMSGIGGGSFIIYYDYKNKSVYALDGREEAPNAYHGKIFCKNPDCLSNENCADCLYPNQTATYNEKRIGGLSVGVPGTLYVFYNLYKYFGSGKEGNEWSDLLEYAKKLSFEGFPMYDEMFNYLNESNSCLRRFDDSFDLFYNDSTNAPIPINATFKNEKFGNLLQQFQDLGAEESINWFYNGSLAETIVNATSNNPNIWLYENETVQRPGLMTMNDMSGYKAVFREVVESDYGDTDYRMYGMNMPSSGGPSVQYLMNLMYSLLNNDNLSYLNASHILNEPVGSMDNLHFLISANNIAFSDRNQYMADSDFINVPVHGLINFSYISNERAPLFSNNFIETPIQFGQPPNVNYDNIHNQTSMLTEEHGTSHFFVVDKDNNIATITTTIEGLWGSCIAVPDYGFLLNNELTDFDSLGFDHLTNKTIANGPQGGKRRRRSALNIFGLTDDQTFGGKRPRSSMSPSLVLNKVTKEPILSIGSPGGSTIISTTFESMFNVLLRGYNVQKAIDEGRIWSFNGDEIRIEEKLWQNVTKLVQNKGYEMSYFRNTSHGTAQGVEFRKTVHCKGFKDFYVLEGGADDLRWSTATALPVCSGHMDDSSEFCIEHANVCISSLTNGQRAALIIVWSILLVVALCLVMNREKLKKWRDRKKNHKIGFIAENELAANDEFTK